MGLLVADRTWQRWVEQKLLPAPVQINGFSRKARLFFEGSLLPVALSGGFRSAAALDALGVVGAETQLFFGSAEFVRLADVVRAHVDELPSTDIATISGMLAVTAPNVVADLAGAVQRHEQALLRRSIEFRAVRAVFLEMTSTVALLRTVDGEELQVSPQRFAAARTPGIDVLVQRVRARGITGTFVLPATISPSAASWKEDVERHLDEVAAITASDDGAVEREYSFLYRWAPAVIRAWKARAAEALTGMHDPTEWDAFLGASRHDAGSMILVDPPPEVHYREPAGVLATAGRDGWERQLLDAPDPLAALPRRRRR